MEKEAGESSPQRHRCPRCPAATEDKPRPACLLDKIKTMAHRAQAQIYTWGRGESKSHEPAGWGGSISGLRILLRWKQRSAISGRRQKILAERGTGGILLGEAGQNTVHTAEAQCT